MTSSDGPDDPAADRPRPAGPPPTVRRSAARLAAVQALYQLSFNAGPVDQVIREFRTHRLGRTLDGDDYVEADPALFAAIVGGVSARKPDIARMLSAARDGDRSIDRIEPLLRVLMEAGIWELAANGDAPARVVLSDYVDLAHAFFSGPEPGMVNAVLDRLARRLRAGEMGEAADGAADPADADGAAPRSA